MSQDTLFKRGANSIWIYCLIVWIVFCAWPGNYHQDWPRVTSRRIAQSNIELNSTRIFWMYVHHHSHHGSSTWVYVWVFLRAFFSHQFLSPIEEWKFWIKRDCLKRAKTVSNSNISLLSSHILYWVIFFYQNSGFVWLLVTVKNTSCHIVSLSSIIIVLQQSICLLIVYFWQDYTHPYVD